MELQTNQKQIIESEFESQLEIHFCKISLLNQTEASTEN